MVSEAPDGILTGRIGIGRNLATAIGNRNAISTGQNRSLQGRILALIQHQRVIDLGRCGRTC